MLTLDRREFIAAPFLLALRRTVSRPPRGGFSAVMDDRGFRVLQTMHWNWIAQPLPHPGAIIVVRRAPRPSPRWRDPQFELLGLLDVYGEDLLVGRTVAGGPGWISVDEHEIGRYGWYESAGRSPVTLRDHRGLCDSNGWVTASRARLEAVYCERNLRHWV